MAILVSVKPGGDPKFSFRSCQKEGLECTRDTALRHLIELAGLHWNTLRWCSLNILRRKGPRRLVCLCNQLCCCTVGEKEAWFPSAVFGLLTSPNPALLWLHGCCRSQGKELPQALSLNLCSTSCTQMTWRSRGRRMAPSEAAWTPLKIIVFELERGRRSSISPSDPFLPKKHSQSSFCTGSCFTNLAGFLCYAKGIFLVLLLRFMAPLCLEIVFMFHQKNGVHSFHVNVEFHKIVLWKKKSIQVQVLDGRKGGYLISYLWITYFWLKRPENWSTLSLHRLPSIMASLKTLV